MMPLESRFLCDAQLGLATNHHASFVKIQQEPPIEVLVVLCGASINVQLMR